MIESSVQFSSSLIQLYSLIYFLWGQVHAGARHPAHQIHGADRTDAKTLLIIKLEIIRGLKHETTCKCINELINDGQNTSGKKKKKNKTTFPLKYSHGKNLSARDCY